MSDYFAMKGYAEEPIILVYSIKDPSDNDSWMWGRPFIAKVQEPVEAVVIPDNDKGVLLPFYNTPQIMRKDVYEALTNAGVDNIEVYRAVVKTEEGNIVSDDYLAYNIIGVVKAVDISKTQFAPENPSRLIDASVEKLTINANGTKGLLLFRLAESIRTIMVHDRVKAAIESRRIPYIVFLGGNDFLF